MYPHSYSSAMTPRPLPDPLSPSATTPMTDEAGVARSIDASESRQAVSAARSDADRRDPVDATATLTPASTPTPIPTRRSVWRRLPWLVAGVISLALGVLGIFLPLLPTTPFVLLAAFCFARGSQRCERWLVTHPRFGPMIAQWRAHRAVPLRAKRAAWLMMTLSSLIAAWTMPTLRWLPALCCLAVGLWLWRLPTARAPAEPMDSPPLPHPPSPVGPRDA